jgi:hypothetical protein
VPCLRLLAEAGGLGGSGFEEAAMRVAFRGKVAKVLPGLL